MNPCSISEFEKHIRFLSGHYKSASLTETFKAGKENVDERYYSITFDDGIKDQYENAAPILERYDARATFFLITETLEGRLPSAHKFHVILSRVSPLEVIDIWNVFLKKEHSQYATRFFIPKDVRIVKDRRLYADIPTANLKETFTSVSVPLRDQFLCVLFKKYGFNEKELCEKMFLSPGDIEDLDRRGFATGIHTHVHEPLSSLGKDGFREDFSTARGWFKKVTGRDPHFFSYPYGIIPEWGDEAVRREGITHGVTVLERPVNRDDSPLLIPRYDMATIRTFLSHP